MWRTLVFVSLFCGLTVGKEKAIPVKLTEDTWQNMLEGEWLVKFYAPWCPACKALEPTWEAVAGWGQDLDMKVADVDVTENPGLSGRFLVTSLPTIYHVKDGVFRTYRGSRDEEDLISYVDEKKWEQVDPLSWWTSPSSAHMGILSWFFKVSMLIRELHTAMTEQYGIPIWASYAICAVSTIIIGLFLGMMIVVCIDICAPPGPPPRYPDKYGPQGDYLDTDDSRDSDNIEDDRPGHGDQNNVRHREPTHPPAD